ncbi:glycosyltransferase family 4 protein [Haloarcula sp. 1CSR25-25]|uniref:glycosyltransferase family 4 protein n=1 Tax=Haloarcula sp. 1CSR25-25 TaxID=2862545 RepID=UPI0028957C1F|nr:glycosyltransferase family 4 protein [Haloarcula sp. 1CSR25-25]MDT3435471.1 glycosyltransferase family 4 protein [Haloarcula sp. 1CSR25-25]
MDVAFVTSQVYPYRKGGTEKRIHEIGKRLVGYGHEVTVYGCHWWDGASENENRGMTLKGISPGREQYVGNRRSIAEALRFSTDLLQPLRQKIDDHDVVVVCVSEHFPVWVSALLSSTSDTPIVTTWHEVWTREYWKSYLGLLGNVGWVVQLITGHLPQNPVAVSSMTADRLAKIGPNRDSIEVIPNGIDIGKIRSAPAAGVGFDILFVGRLIPEKNVDLLLTAFDQVSEAHDVTLGIIGDGPQREELQSLAGSLSHSDCVTFLGFLKDNTEVYGHMKAAEIFVLPSVREGFGISALEAMSAGCIPITVDHPDSGASEVVGDCGFVTDVTASAVAEAINKSIRGETPDGNPVKRAEKFDWDRIARQAEYVYQNAAGESAQRVQTW